MKGNIMLQDLGQENVLIDPTPIDPAPLPEQDWYKSNTIQVNAVIMIIAILPLINALVAQINNAPQDPTAITLAVTSFLGGALTIYLRVFKTKTVIKK
jgi:uncharacterized membrane protein